MSTVLITGGAGFIGTNLADSLLRSGRRVRILDDLSRPGVEGNLAWLESRHPGIQFEHGSVADAAAVRRVLRGVRQVFHLAAQTAVTTSLVEPMEDAVANLLGTLSLLEEARRRPRPPSIVFTSTNKVYGSLPDLDVREGRFRYERDGLRPGISEDRRLSFCTPYGCSKGAADQYVLDWHGSFGVPTVVFRMSCIYGPHQHGTEDQGWVAHFLLSALRGEPITIYGDGKQVRDVLYVDDLVRALREAQGEAERLAGRAFNIGGGPDQAVSLLDVVDLIAEVQGEPPEVRMASWRPGDQRYYVSDTGAFTAATRWHPTVAPADGIRRLHEWLASERDVTATAA